MHPPQQWGTANDWQEEAGRVARATSPRLVSVVVRWVGATLRAWYDVTGGQLSPRRSGQRAARAHSGAAAALPSLSYWVVVRTQGNGGEISVHLQSDQL